MKRLVTLFIPDMRGGGAQRVTAVLAREFLARGLDVDLVVLRAEGPFMSAVPHGARIVDLGRRLRLPGRAGHAVTALIGLRRYLRRRRPWCVLSALTGANLAAVAVRALFGPHVPLVLAEHNTLLNVDNPVYVRAMRGLYPLADAVAAVSHGIAADLTGQLGLDEDRVRVINNPHDVVELRRLASAPCSHPWLNDADRPVLIGIGRLSPQKDFATLIEAFARARARCALRLVILGAGEQHDALRALAKRHGVADDVDLPGYVTNPFALLARASLFVMSSRWEGLPNTLIEAMVLGTPMVSTDCHSGPAEILDNGRFGALVPVGDAAALADAILAQLDAPHDRDALMQRAAMYAPEVIARHYLELLETVATPR